MLITAFAFYPASLRSWGELFEPTYLIAETDRGSQAKAEAFELNHGRPKAHVVRVPRAREVGQRYTTSVLTTTYAAWFSLRIVLSELPDIIFANGPGTCVPVVFAAYVARFLGLKHILVMYSESFACVEHLSLSGRLIYHLADGFTVQWPQLLQSYPKAKYAGRIHPGGHESQDMLPLAPDMSSEIPTAIVTVGSTFFDDLIAAVDCAEFISCMRSLGIRRLKVQRGRGQYHPQFLVQGKDSSPDFGVEVVDYVADLPAELQRAALIVSHAGAGTILDCLDAGRRLVVVPNERLMANHQVQLGMALHRQRLLFCFSAGELAKQLQEADFDSLRRFPPDINPTFAQRTLEMLGF